MNRSKSWPSKAQNEFSESLSRQEIVKRYDHNQLWVQNIGINNMTAVNRPCCFSNMVNCEVEVLE